MIMMMNVKIVIIIMMITIIIICCHQGARKYVSWLLGGRGSICGESIGWKILSWKWTIRTKWTLEDKVNWSLKTFSNQGILASKTSVEMNVDNKCFARIKNFSTTWLYNSSEHLRRTPLRWRCWSCLEHLEPSEYMLKYQINISFNTSKISFFQISQEKGQW